MEEIKLKLQDNPVMADNENVGRKSYQEHGSRLSQTAKWAKMWREQHNNKLIAKRERKRSHQMLGMWQLSKELEELE